ncbi:MAG: CoA pyrophosphatase [Hornefia sp.]|nr:CoA pyrophosphatase [Hornefia sp.]
MINLEKIMKLYKDRPAEYIGKHKDFSVLVPIVRRGEKLFFMYEVRSGELDSDPGEICFPGGHVEEGETFKEAAYRETAEETGISSEKIKEIGTGGILQGYANYTLYTYIGLIEYEDYVDAEIERSEVQELFLVDIEELRNVPFEHIHQRVVGEMGDDFPYEKIGIDREYKWRQGSWIIPVVKIDGRTIWGLTARITEHVLETFRNAK